MVIYFYHRGFLIYEFSLIIQKTRGLGNDM